MVRRTPLLLLLRGKRKAKRRLSQCYGRDGEPPYLHEAQRQLQQLQYPLP